MEHNKDLHSLENIIGYTFKDINLLKNALTHSSYANEIRRKSIKDNERLEFLGDAVLELTSSDYIYNTYLDKSEGYMTKLRASIVCEPTLAMCARAFKLHEYIMLGKGENLTGGRNRDSIISDACEALIGAIYLDGGFTNAKEFICRFILNDLDNKTLFFDSKTILQEVAQSMGLEVTYNLLDETGPEHDKSFVVECSCGSLCSITASGHTKKSAQQKAAFDALIHIKNQGHDISLKGMN